MVQWALAGSRDSYLIRCDEADFLPQNVAPSSTLQGFREQTPSCTERKDLCLTSFSTFYDELGPPCRPISHLASPDSRRPSSPVRRQFILRIATAGFGDHNISPCIARRPRRIYPHSPFGADSPPEMSRLMSPLSSSSPISSSSAIPILFKCALLPLFLAAVVAAAVTPARAPPDTFDYVIVGGGTAGLVLAERYVFFFISFLFPGCLTYDICCLHWTRTHCGPIHLKLEH